MRNQFIVKEIMKKENTIEFEYEIIGEWKKYFDTKKRFKIEYTISIEEVPKSICVIPLITDILPISWIFDAEIVVDEIDKQFYESIAEFKKGFIKMYPMLEFAGKITVNHILDNSYESQDRVGQFFSGGVDAFSTLITHIEEKPILINIQGSDIDVNDEETIKNVQKDINKTAEQFGLDAIFIKSTFKRIIKHRYINFYIKPKSGDNYWHGFQHGIAIIGHAAPIAYVYRLKTVYIASSFTKEDKEVTCASDPTIDDFVKLSSTRVFHDGYEYNRGDKIRNIIQYCSKENQEIKLRVCFNENSPENCCSCEKCYRTIYEIIANGYDPHKLGFYYENTMFQKMKKDFQNKIVLNHTKHWKRIQNTLKQKNEVFENNEDFKWLLDYQFSTKYTVIKKINKVYFAVKKRLKRLIEKSRL